VLEAAQQGDMNCRKLIRQQGEYLGIAIANALNLLDLQLVIIGGEMGCVLGEVLLPHIRDTVKLRAPYLPKVEFEVSKLGMLAASIGASAYLIGS
jgi:predicted NBD/HSP70 family sugar kinase